MFFGKKVKAQGTIEYLVILAVIVIVSLIVVSLLVNSTSGAEGISSGTSKIGGWTNTISVTESAISPDGNYLVRLANNTGEPVTIKTVKIGDQDVNYSEDLFQGNQQNFKITSDMVCELGQTVVGELVVTYVSQNGLEHTEVFPADITFECNDYIVNLLANQCETCTTYTTRYLSPDSYTLTGGLYDTNDLRTIDTNLIAGDIRSGATIFGVSGNSNVVNTSSGDASATEILDGYVAWVDGSEVTGSVATQTLSADSVDVDAGYYAETDLNVIDSDLNSDNIKSDVDIFGITGTYSGSGGGATLIWSDPASGAPFDWATAHNKCAEMNSVDWTNPAYEGWRMPTADEMQAAFDAGLPWTLSDYLWTSTTVPSGTIYAYYLSSSYGFDYSDKTNDYSYEVRCVRSE